RRDQFSQSRSKPIQKVKEIEYQNLRFPTDLSNPYAVATVLNQEPGKLRIKDLKEVLSQAREGIKTREMKEAMFQLKVKKLIREEEANHLKWQVHKGKDPISVEFKNKIIESRQREEEQYKIQRGGAVIEQEFQRNRVEVSSRRVIRRVDQHPNVHPTFDLLPIDPWDHRSRMFRKFQQAAYKVLNQIRLNRLLLLFRGLTREAKGPEEGSVPESRRLTKPEKSEEHRNFASSISKDRVLPFEFPFYSSQKLHHDLAPDALGPVPIEPVDMKVTHILPFYDFKVPRHFKVMKYRPICTDYAATSYKSQKLSRPLRQRTEDELVQVVASPEEQLTLVSQRTDFQKPSPEEAAEKGISLLKLVPPQALVYPKESNPLRIFNPTPGLVPFLLPLAYSETSMEYHLCPHPKYTFTKECPKGSSIPVTQKKFLHHKEVICGVMEWRNFSPLVYSSFPNVPTLINSAPRDPYSLDMLPRDVPPMLHDLPERDKENIIDNETDEAEFTMIPTPEMIRAEFPQIEQALSEEGKEKSAVKGRPDGHFQHQNNELGEKIQKHIETMKQKALYKALIL
ncbi:Primary ciliary dyskinesia protein 1, partial [Acanthisitta chloris]